MTELKPCPFCGTENPDLIGGGNSYLVRCHHCKASGAWGDSAIDAESLWNTRVTTPETESTPTNDEDLSEICCQLKRENNSFTCSATNKEPCHCGTCDIRLGIGADPCHCPLMWKDEPTIQKIVKECDALRELLVNKNTNYGNAALTVPPFVPTLTPREALLVRLGDKFQRLQTLTKGEPDLVGESITDTIRDIAGYCVLILIESEK